MLFLAGPDRMDTDLVIAQMQGRFKLVCFVGEVGHTMHEDEPFEAANELYKFLKRFKIPFNKTHSKQIKELGLGKFSNGI